MSTPIGEGPLQDAINSCFDSFLATEDDLQVQLAAVFKVSYSCCTLRFVWDKL